MFAWSPSFLRKTPCEWSKVQKVQNCNGVKFYLILHCSQVVVRLSKMQTRLQSRDSSTNPQGMNTMLAFSNFDLLDRLEFIVIKQKMFDSWTDLPGSFRTQAICWRTRFSPHWHFLKTFLRMKKYRKTQLMQRLEVYYLVTKIWKWIWIIFNLPTRSRLNSYLGFTPH